ncbi:hypothetical protein CLOLEP_03495 [[Clostridium] leptum DSM 753]|uniref:Uncharacterized protein n=1 Tax=[Clostridium] leptum DSM 753 TaxID=428125 RepID=A7VY19_9FIRM|nr:hypothetical protein CLOLEP_03495 [[Clostridium] leptum DSM 753]
MKLWQFSACREHRIYGYEQPHLRTRLSLKAKAVSQMLSLPEDGTIPLRDCPISTGKKSTLSAKLSGSLKEPDIFSVQGSATRKDACGELITSSMSSRLTWIYLHWKIQHWEIQHWKILRRKNLRWKIQCN